MTILGSLMLHRDLRSLLKMMRRPPTRRSSTGQTSSNTLREARKSQLQPLAARGEPAEACLDALASPQTSVHQLINTQAKTTLTP